ncbi:MAG: PilZ domain-containing protein [Cystobacter sp.]
MSNLSGPERRRHTRHRVRMRIKILRGEVEVAGEIFNISRSGCLLVTPVAMRVGERFTVQLPMISSSAITIQVVRSRKMGEWFAVATHFESHLADETPIIHLVSQDPDPAPEEDPEQLF